MDVFPARRFHGRLFPGRPFPEASWRALTLAAILLLHAALLHALSGAQFQPTPPTAPLHEVIASFVAPEPPAPAPRAEPHPRPHPIKPTAAPTVKHKPAPQPKPAAREPAPQAISEPPSPVEPAPAAAPPAPAAPTPSAPGTPSASAAPSTLGTPKTLTSSVQYLQPPRPEYPPISRRMGEEGRSVLRVLINEQGRAERAELQQSSGSTRLDEAARQAVLRALFKPYIENGRPVAVFAIIPISFQLD